MFFLTGQTSTPDVKLGKTCLSFGAPAEFDLSLLLTQFALRLPQLQPKSLVVDPVTLGQMFRPKVCHV